MGLRAILIVAAGDWSEVAVAVAVAVGMVVVAVLVVAVAFAAAPAAPTAAAPAPAPALDGVGGWGWGRLLSAGALAADGGEWGGLPDQGGGLTPMSGDSLHGLGCHFPSLIA